MTNPASPGEPCWIELAASDTDVVTRFYGEVFGWTAQSAGEDYGGYINFSSGDTVVAGCMAKPPEMAGMPDAWSVYLASGDAQATVDAAASKGGAVMLPPMEVPQIGVMAFVTDPGGAAIGVFQATGEMDFGYSLDAVGAPGWFELQTKDYDASVDFYASVFGWDVHTASDTPELRYTTLGEGEGQRAGVMDASGFLPEGVPAQWAVYVRVADADATLATITANGGRIVMPAEDTPYGRLAVAADPNGAVFKLIQGG